jgi:NAD(P)-dependent dehydrogenase (short-subunit alcohol dehydrogenase family)
MEHAEKRVVLITGAAGDIGSAVASHFAQSHALVLADHPNAEPRLAELAEKLSGDGASVFPVTFDVTDRSDVDRALAHCVEQFAAPSLLFNNAGYQGAFNRIDRMDSDDVVRVLMINVGGVFNVTAAFSSNLIGRQASGGAIVNTASMAGVGGAPNMAGYSASKAAVIGLTKSAAKDLAPFGIRVNAISPAFIGPGAMWERQVELQAAAQSQYYATDPVEVAKQMIGMVPMRRYGSTDEVASVVAFLLSEASSYLTGVNIEIAGGSA